jgi:hypothetical protein
VEEARRIEYPSTIRGTVTEVPAKVGLFSLGGRRIATRLVGVGRLGSVLARGLKLLLQSWLRV